MQFHKIDLTGKTLQRLCLLMFLISLNSCGSGYDRDKVEKTHKLKEPLNTWVKIEPLHGEHVIRAVKPYAWSYNNQFEDVYLGAKGGLQPLGPEETPNPSGKLGFANVEKLHTYQIDNYNASLSKALGKVVTYKEVYTLRVFSDGFAYDLSFYSDGSNLEYVKVCLDHCLNVEPKIIKVNKKI